MNKNKKGFTIIELIVVIAIIAILAAIVLVNVTQYINKAKTSSVQANLSTVETSMAAYLADPSNGTTNGVDIRANKAGVSNCYSPSPAAVAIKANDSGSVVPTCYGDTAGTNWCAYAPTLTSTGVASYWCVDSNGYHGGVYSSCTADTSAGAKCQ